MQNLLNKSGSNNYITCLLICMSACEICYICVCCPAVCHLVPYQTKLNNTVTIIQHDHLNLKCPAEKRVAMIYCSGQLLYFHSQMDCMWYNI